MALSAEELQQLQQWYGGGISSGQDSTTINGQTYGTTGIQTSDEGGVSYNPNTLINYDPGKLAPGDSYNIVDPNSGNSAGTGQWLNGDHFQLKDFKDLGEAVLTLGSMYLGGQALIAAGAGSAGGIGGSGFAAGGGAETGVGAGNAVGSAAYMSPGEMDQVLASQVAGQGGVTGGAAAGASGSYLSPGEVDQTLAEQTAGGGGVTGTGAGTGLTTNQLDHATGVDYGGSGGGAAAGAGGAGAGAGAGAGGAGAGAGGAGAGAAGAGLGGAGDLIKGAGGIISGIDANNRANQIAHQSDPFAKYRDKFGQALVGLWDDPSTITKMPGYQAGMTAVERSLGSQGYTGSGNMMAALQQYGGSFFDKTLSELAGLSGATVTPGNGALGAANLAGQGQGSIGYGVNSLVDYFTGNSTGQSGAGGQQVGYGPNPWN